MIPYVRYLKSLHLIYKCNEEKVVKDLKKFGLPSDKKIFDSSLDQFLRTLGRYSKSLSSCLYIEFSENAFKEISVLLDVDKFFEGKKFKDTFPIASDPLIKKHVECCILTKVEFDVIVEDVLKLYRTEISVDNIIEFKNLFFELKEISNTYDFTRYADLLPPEERALKNKCRANGPQYTRWALGADVELDSKKITKEMIADVYFRYKEKASDGTSDSFEKAMKLGSLATKLIDRELKINAITIPDNDDLGEKFGEQLCLFDQEDDDPKLAGDINKDE